MTATPKQLAHAFIAVAESCEEKELKEVSEQFVSYLQSEHLLGKARAILDALHQAWKERYGISQVKITTAHPLSKKSLQALEKSVRGASVETQVDPSLIGGATLRIDDRILDGSISGQLASLKQTLLET